MITKDECLEKINEMLPIIRDNIMSKSVEALNSGAIDFQSFDKDYVLPKAIVCVVLESITSGYMPFSKDGKEVVKNLRNF